MKNAAAIDPARVKSRPKSAINQGKSEGMTRWKKCEVACAKPTSDMTRASAAREMGAAASIRDAVYRKGAAACSVAAPPCERVATAARRDNVERRRVGPCRNGFTRPI